MIGKTSPLMFPIYGLAAVIRPVYGRLSDLPVCLRGVLYALGIYCAEFTFGTILRFFHMCPWDYSQAAFQYRGLIRLDYFPLWFLMGLFYEKLLLHLYFTVPVQRQTVQSSGRVFQRCVKSGIAGFYIGKDKKCTDSQGDTGNQHPADK